MTDDKQSSIPRDPLERYDGLVKQNQDELMARGKWPPVSSHTQAVDNYKMDELKFRLSLIALDTDRPRDGLDWNELQELSMATLMEIARRVFASGSAIPGELISHLEKVIKGRKAIHSSDSLMFNTNKDADGVGHAFHITELERLHSQLKNPPIRKNHEEVMKERSWRRNTI